MKSRDSFATVSTLFFQGRSYRYFSIPELSERLEFNPAKLPFTVRILMENMLRSEDGRQVKEADIRTMARAYRDNEPCGDIAFKPTRVLMQDFTGVPSVADLAAMRDALGDMGGDPGKINPQIPVELVIDHSVQLDRFGTESAFAANASKELKRNRERYGFLNWGQKNLKNFSVIPPATGICHQVNLEYLGRVVTVDDTEEYPVLYPDTLVGLDSHTTMINGIGVLGWGVGGIEAEAVMLGQPYYMPAPDVLGFELTGRLQPGVTATDLVLTITEMLRQKGVVGRFVEFFGPGLDSLTVPDRATIANMSPEFGATAAYFPVDEKTLEYLLFTGRPRHQVDLAASYLKAQQLFFNSSASPPAYCETMQLALETVEPCLAGPRRPQDRIALSDMKQRFQQDYERIFSTPGRGGKDPCWEAEGGAVVDEERWRSRMIHRRPAYGDGVFIKRPYQSFYLDHGSVVIAAITSCTNTSNPAVLLGAGLVAKKAVKMGLQVRPWVKASLTPGSRVVSDYLEASGLMAYLEALRFHVAAYGCSTCIGNSGPLQEDVKEAVKNTGLVAAAVLSGNRNYEGRINSLVQANYLASPMLVVAYALAGTVNFNPQTEPIGHSGNNEPVYLKDIWPSEEESLEVMGYPQPAMFVSRYAEVFEGDENWRQISAGDTLRYQWDADSEYLKRPPFFGEMAEPTAGPADVESARMLAMLGDSITTDHIS
ncbi:MAG: aconitate hydratase AcnA, partial [Desulfosalsimonas sp.]